MRSTEHSTAAAAASQLWSGLHSSSWQQSQAAETEFGYVTTTQSRACKHAAAASAAAKSSVWMLQH